MSKQKMTPKEVAVTRLSALMGEVLTVIEAIVPPVEQDMVVTYTGNGTAISSTYSSMGIPSRQNTQREAVKDLIRTAFGRAQSDVEKWID